MALSLFLRSLHHCWTSMELRAAENGNFFFCLRKNKYELLFLTIPDLCSNGVSRDSYKKLVLSSWWRNASLYHDKEWLRSVHIIIARDWSYCYWNTVRKKTFLFSSFRSIPLHALEHPKNNFTNFLSSSRSGGWSLHCQHSPSSEFHLADFFIGHHSAQVLSVLLEYIRKKMF